MGKYYVVNEEDPVDIVVMIDSVRDEYYIEEDSAKLFSFSDGSNTINFYKSDIDKMIALFQAAKDKLCN